MQKTVLLLGKQDTIDYPGSKTLYTYKALSEAGAAVKIYDVDKSGDIPVNVSVSIFLPWVEQIDSRWAKFIKIIPGRRCLFTDNWYWYDQCSGKIFQESGINFEDLFHVVGFATTEHMKWWPKSKYEWWGTVVDEDLARPRTPQDYIYVDEIWPDEWCRGIYNSKAVLDIAIPKIKEEFGVGVLTQEGKEGLWEKPSWADEVIAPRIDLEKMLTTLSGAKAFITSHHECLGLMQFEALTCGVPVITNPSFSKSETFACGEHSVHPWIWTEQDNEEQVDIERAANLMIDSIRDSFKADRDSIRENAVARFGKKAWVERVSGTILG